MARRALIGGALAVLALAGGACTFQPRIGMSFDDWNRECRTKTLGGGTLVEQKGTTAVYYCDKRDVFYTFENGGLAAIRNQPAYGPGDNFRVGR